MTGNMTGNMTTPATSSETSRLRGSLFTSPEDRRARPVPSPLPQGSISPALSPDGDVFIATQGQYSPPVDSTVCAVDPLTGQERWKSVLKADMVVAPVPSADGQTVWASGEAVVGAFSATTGESQGTWGPGTRDCLRPVPLEGNRVVLANWRGNRLAALEPGQSGPVWEAEVGPTYGTPAAGAGRVYASVYNGWQADAGGVIQALDARTGQPLWRYESESPIHTSPAVGPDGSVYVARDQGGLVALDPRTGEERWQAPTPGRPAAPPAFSTSGEQVYLADTSGAIQALDTDTGVPIWRTQTSGSVNLSPGVGARGTLCILSQDGRATVLEAERGRVAAEVDLEGLPGAAPVPLEDGSFLVWNLAGQTQRVVLPKEETPEESGVLNREAAGIQVGEDQVSIGGVTLPRR